MHTQQRIQTVGTLPTIKTLSFQLSEDLKELLEFIAHLREMKLEALMSWAFEIVLPIAQAEPRYRLAPRKFDESPLLPERSKVRLGFDHYRFIEVYGDEQGLAVAHQARQFLWFFIGCHELLDPNGSFRKEELSRRIKDLLVWFWGKPN